MSRIISRVKFNPTAKRNSFPYQIEAFLTLKDLNYSAIFHEQGLGKTKIAIDLLLYWLQHRNIDTVMIITKKQLVKNWIEEFDFHTYITPKILGSNKRDNFYVFNSAAKVIISNFETISTEKERVQLFLKCRDVAIIIDESAKLKNPESKLTKDFLDISDLFKIKTIMTGTPIANRPYDLWSQVFFLDKGQSLGNNFADFKKNTNLSNNLSYDIKSRKRFEENISSIYKKISAFSVRETKESCGIALPSKEYETIYTDFEDIQRSMYRRVVSDLEIEIKMNGMKIIDDDSIALKRLLRLVQICSNPALIDESYSNRSAKEILLDNLLTKIVKGGDKCIVWSCFIDNVNKFYKRYADYSPCIIHGSMSISERNMSIDKFRDDDHSKILFATPQSAKEGLTLTVANHVVFYDRGFNLDDYLQAQDRIHRISQTKTCYIYNLMIKNSIDEWVDKLIEAKHFAALLAQGDISLSEYTNSADYSYSDIINGILAEARR